MREPVKELVRKRVKEAVENGNGWDVQPDWYVPKRYARLTVRASRPSSGQGESRTHDTRIFSPLLYCLSYLSLSIPL
jgi:hypothetical protein